MSYTLYSYPNNYRAQKAQVAAQYCGVDIELPAFKLGEDNKTDAFKAKAPLQKVPVLDTPDGPIWESHAIARYVARLRPDKHLLGHSFYEQGLVDQWIDFSTTELEPARALWLYPILGYMEFNQQAYQAAKKDAGSALRVLNAHLLKHTYLVGNQITLADICICVSLVEMYQKVFAPGFIRNFSNVTRWFNTCINQPEFAGVLGKVVFATKEIHAPKPKKEKKKGSKKGKKGSKKDQKKIPTQTRKEKKNRTLVKEIAKEFNELGCD
jgi:elongation factor 1-gamma